jgi:ketol-acid reductoisomerase
VSDTAEWGDLTSGPRVVDATVKSTMQQLLTEIQDGTFAKNWVEESRAGRERFLALEAAGHDHPIEKVGKELRAMMPWISAGKQSVADTSGGQGMN